MEDRALADPNDEKHLQANTDYSSEDDNVGSTLAVMDGDPAEINIGMLKRFLKSFGGLRFFSVEKDMEDKKKVIHPYFFFVLRTTLISIGHKASE